MVSLFLYILLFIIFLVPAMIVLFYLIAGIKLIFKGGRENSQIKIRSGKRAILYLF